jgi:uncharacterized protein YjbI with pentapeptide repeats
MRGAKLGYAILRSAIFEGADLSYADLSDVRVDEKTNFSGADLRHATFDEERIRAICITSGMIVKKRNFYDRFLYYAGCIKKVTPD